MRDIRLVALDVDGTILDSSGSLSPRLRRAASAATERGVTVALATARRWTGASPIAGELAVARSLILYDGAIRRVYPDGAVEETAALAVEVAQIAAERIHARGLCVVAQYSPPEGERMVANEVRPRGPWMDSYLTTYDAQIIYRPVHALLTEYALLLRLVSFGPEEMLGEIASELADLPTGVQILPMGSYGVAELTVFSAGASKGAALRRLAGALDVSMTETLAIGDGVNDISMLRAAGLGVAMGHAAAEVRQAADVVTATNDEDGAALAIERYVLGIGDGEILESPWDEEETA